MLVEFGFSRYFYLHCLSDAERKSGKPYIQLSIYCRHLRCYYNFLVRSITALKHINYHLLYSKWWCTYITASTEVVITEIIENKYGSPAASKCLLTGRIPADIFLLTSFFFFLIFLNLISFFRSKQTLMSVAEEVPVKW